MPKIHIRYTGTVRAGNWSTIFSLNRKPTLPFQPQLLNVSITIKIMHNAYFQATVCGKCSVLQFLPHPAMVASSTGCPTPSNWPMCTHEPWRRRLDIPMWADSPYTARWPQHAIWFIWNHCKSCKLDFFLVGVGLCQCCPRSPILFVIFSLVSAFHEQCSSVGFIRWWPTGVVRSRNENQQLHV